MSAMFAMGGCVCCGAMFSFNPDLVPSTTAFNGKREPVCATCMAAANLQRVERGLAPHPILPGAYDITEGP